MQGLRLRMVWSVAAAFLAAWLLGGRELEPMALAAFAVAAVIAYVAWPAFAAGLPPAYALRVTTRGIVAAFLVGIAYAVLPVVQGTGAVSIASLTVRFVAMALLAVTASVVFSVIGARVFNRQPADR